MTHVSFEPILRSAVAYWSTGILATALEHDIFTHLSAGPMTKEALAATTRLSDRGAQALLDGLTGLGLTLVDDHRYRNSAEANEYLVRGKESYFGDFVLLNFKTMPRWMGLPRAAQTGDSVLELSGMPDHEYWEELVTAIAPLSLPVAETAARHLRIADKGPISILDVAGGAGAFSAVFLAANPSARSTQVDWANVNRVARALVANRGVGDRFDTVDGDFLAVDYGDARHDVVVYSHMAHGVSAEQNVEALSKIRRALRPGGVLVINEFVVNDDGTAHPFILMFSCNILFHSSTGRGWREGDYRRWLHDTGFRDVAFEPTGTPATLIYARI